MTQALPINRLVNVQVNLSPLAAQMQNISTLLLLGSSDVIDATERFRTYSSIANVASDFETTDPEYLAALLWFEQSPQPTTIQIGRWVKTAIAGQLKTATLSAAQRSMAVWNAITSGSFHAIIDNIPLAVTGLNFATATNLNGVAGIIETALAALSANTKVVWNSNYNRFEFKSGTTGNSSGFNFLKSPTAVGRFTLTANPANNDTITLNGTTVTFITGVPTGNQVAIGGSVAATLANLLTFLNTSQDVQILKFTYSVVGNVLALAAAVAGASGNALTIAKTSANITVSGATLAGAVGTDISDELAGRSDSSGAYVADGLDAETAIDAVTLFDDNYGQGWYALSVLGASDSDHLSCASYIEAATTKHIYGVSTTQAGVISPVDTTNIARQLKEAGYKRTTVQFSSSNPYAVCSLLGRILTTNYDANNSVITLMYKQEPGIVPETLNVSQITALEFNNCNVFVAYNNNTAIIQQGKVSSGEFLDVITGTDWLALDMQNEAFNLLYTSTTKVPQTDAGNNLIATVLEASCSRGLNNGLLAPGVWTAGGFGSLNTGDFLPKGYYIYAPPIASQSQANRAARKSVPFQVAAKLAGAIHTIEVIINVNR